MAVQKDTSLKDDSETKVVSGGSVQPKHGFNKKTLVILCAVAVLLVAGAIIYREENRIPTQQEISYAQNKGQYDKAEKLIKKAIKHTSSKSQKANLYVELGNTYVNAQASNQAVDAYKQAANTGGMTYTVAQQLATTYLQKGDKQQGIFYLQKAIELWPKTDPMYNYEVNSMKQTIQHLQQEGGQ